MGALAKPVGVIEAQRRACDRKTRFGSEQAARHGARWAINFGDRHERPDRLWVYPCYICRGWHMTSSPNRDPAVTARELREGVPC